MAEIPFFKYTAYGNTFAIIDEAKRPLLAEGEKSRFARQATDPFFGIGVDNLLVIQSCEKRIFPAIQKAHLYWRDLPDFHAADFVFRMFEPDGSEALCCGNGLLCIADYLFRKYGIVNARVMTELPLPQPNIISLGVNIDHLSSWVNLGQPRRIPANLIGKCLKTSTRGQLAFINNIEIDFSNEQQHLLPQSTTLHLNGHLIFTGEPHLVMFPEQECLWPGISEQLFTTPACFDKHHIEEKWDHGTQLVQYIGSYINTRLKRFFPFGINVNLASFNEHSGELEYRCFERGINRETLACGTGALAVSYVARQLGIVTDSNIVLKPYRCSRHKPHARIRVEATPDGWLLSGNPQALFSGILTDPSACSETHVAEEALRQLTFPRTRQLVKVA